MPKYASLRKVPIDRMGYIQRPDQFAGQYRGVDLFRGEKTRKLYRVQLPDDVETNVYQEFRCVNRAEAVIQARKWLATHHPGLDVRS